MDAYTDNNRTHSQVSVASDWDFCSTTAHIFALLPRDTMKSTTALLLSDFAPANMLPSMTIFGFFPKQLKTMWYIPACSMVRTVLSLFRTIPFSGAMMCESLPHEIFSTILSGKFM